MIKLNDLETFLRIYHVKKVSKTKWKLEHFEIVFLDGMAIIYGKFLYPLAKGICSKPYYSETLFLSEKNEKFPFEYFLTNQFIEDSLSVVSDCLVYGTYEEYSKRYNNYRLEFIKKYISNGISDELFLKKIVITDISTLQEVLLSIRNFYSEIPSKTSIST